MSHAQSAFSSIAALPPDALLGVMAAYRADTRDDKVDLSVGVYKDATGVTPVLAAVRAAEARLLETQTTKVYEGPRGNVEFCAGVEDLVFGDRRDLLGDRVVSFTTPGGCGALFLAIGLGLRAKPDATVFISAPSWPNHNHVAKSLGARVASYPYEAGADGAANIDPILEGLAAAKPGDVLLVQGPCHNPTGIDLTTDGWRKLAAMATEKGLTPVIDVAYHGFGASLDEDLNGVSAFLEQTPNAIVTYSTSKNFGLYRDRNGCVLAQTETAETAAAIASNFADIARASYSMPPAHGAAIVSTILSDPELKAQWIGEVDAIRARLLSLRGAFADALAAHGAEAAAAGVRSQHGMFSQLKLADGAADALRKNNALYFPGSGRLNIAGLPEPDIDRIAALMAPYCVA